jgi:DUF1680 family protein
MLSEWAVMVDDEGIVVNYYGPMEAALRLPDGSDVKLIQKTEYPVDGFINLILTPQREREFNLRLRIPQWSENTIVRANGVAVESVQAGSYLSIDREWNPNDAVEIQLDMSLRFEAGERACAGRVSIYRGPILLAYDQHFNAMDPDDVPALDVTRLDAEQIEGEGQFRPIIMLEVKATDGSLIHLCDFATAGAYGTHYRSWLPAE